MNWKPPRRFYFGFFFFAATIPLAIVPFAANPAPRASEPQSASTATTQLGPKEMLEEKAKVLMAEKRYDAAIQSYQDLLKIDPKNAPAMNMIGIAYLDLSNYDEAKRYFLRSEKADKK